jgi:hypothetical protein
MCLLKCICLGKWWWLTFQLDVHLNDPMKVY